MSKTYFISDLHFGHKNILKYEPIRIDFTLEYIKNELRLDMEHYSKLLGLDHILTKEDVLKDFETEDKKIVSEIITAHDSMLIFNWNSKVKSNDNVIYFLGDLGMGNKEYIKKCSSLLKGNKKMLMGNHDNLPKSFYEDCGFSEVIPRKQELILKDKFILCHIPSDKMNLPNNPYFYIYGHVHSKPSFLTKTQNSQCVCVERQNFEPIEIEEFNKYQFQEIELDPHKEIKEKLNNE